MLIIKWKKKKFGTRINLNLKTKGLPSCSLKVHRKYKVEVL